MTVTTQTNNMEQTQEIDQTGQPPEPQTPEPLPGEALVGTIIPEVTASGTPMPYKPPVDALDFGDAIRALKAGKRVARKGWNGKGMWLSFSPGAKNLPADRFWSEHNRGFATRNGGKANVLPCITMKTADGQILMGWLASQTDMLAEDWEILDA